MKSIQRPGRLAIISRIKDASIVKGALSVDCTKIYNCQRNSSFVDSKGGCSIGYGERELARFYSTSAPKAVNKDSFTKILIANRGEIAVRIIKTAKKLGIKTVAVYSEVDANALHVKMADEAICIGPAPSSSSYINIPALISAIKATGAQAVHPGYGFLSENSEFCKALEKEGVVFIGPSVYSLQSMGDKIQSKQIAKDAGVYTIPGFEGVVENDQHALKLAQEIGYPVMLKASAGGGGKGMRIAWNEEEVLQGFRLAAAESKSSFGDDRLLIEKYIDNPRHIEIQIIGDQHGNLVYLPERECSIQRRNQKVVEEAPSTFLDSETRRRMGEQAVALANRVGYFSAGTVEFLVDSKKNFYFLEMNTRLQVEHPITELITGIDLVEWMIYVAMGRKLPITNQEQVNSLLNGWAIEARVYAEDPSNYLPCIGRLRRYVDPSVLIDSNSHEQNGSLILNDKDGSIVRCDSGIVEGSEISIYYDPMICKLSTWGKTRQKAIDRMIQALDIYVIQGLTHNISLLREIMTHPRFISGAISTKFLKEEYPEGFHGHKLQSPEEKCIVDAAAIMKILLSEYIVQNPLNQIKGIPMTKDPQNLIVSLPANSTAESTRHSYSVSNIVFQQTELFREVSWTVSCIISSTTEEKKSSGNTWAVKMSTLPNSNILYQVSLTPSSKTSKSKGIDSIFQIMDNQNGALDSHALSSQVQSLSIQIRAFGTIYTREVYTTRQAEMLCWLKPKPIRDLSKCITSPMPGNVLSIRVKEGDSIREGAELIVVEAMKMQNVLRASRAGKVKTISVKDGQNVAADDLLLELE
jgi:propionyl-CoA carboxylase alpha chain